MQQGLRDEPETLDAELIQLNTTVADQPQGKLSIKLGIAGGVQMGSGTSDGVSIACDPSVAAQQPL